MAGASLAKRELTGRMSKREGCPSTSCRHSARPLCRDQRYNCEPNRLVWLPGKAQHIYIEREQYIFSDLTFSKRQWTIVNEKFFYTKNNVFLKVVKVLCCWNHLVMYTVTASSLAFVNSMWVSSYALSFFIRYLTECQPSSYTAQFGNGDRKDTPHLSPTHTLSMH